MKIGIIGCGQMGGALLRGILAADVVVPAEILIFDKFSPSVEKLASELGVLTAGSNVEVAQTCDVVLLCTKPYDIPKVLQEVKTSKKPTLFISIAAGLTLAELESYVNDKQRVVRVMPNTPALIGKGAAAYSLGSRATEQDGEVVEKIFSSVGTVSQVQEKLINPVTGLSGSGPAYVYTMIEAMADGAVLMGMTKAQALHFAAQTVMGAASMVLETGQHPAALRDAVCSPGGTTIAAVEALERGNFRHTLISAVKAATEKAGQLSNK